MELIGIVVVTVILVGAAVAPSRRIELRSGMIDATPEWRRVRRVRP